MLAGSNLIHLTDPLAKQAKHVDADLVKPFDERVNLILHCHLHAVNPFQ